MQQDGLVILLIGADLEKFDLNGSIKSAERLTQRSPSAYLALGLAGEDGANALSSHTPGLPQRVLFFNCLKPWSWLSKEAKDIMIDESNVGLNISEYYRVGHTKTSMPNVCDARRLSREKPDAATAKSITDKHYTHAISNGIRNIERIVLFRYGNEDDCVFIMIFLGRAKLVWSFVPAGVSMEIFASMWRKYHANWSGVD